MPISNRMHLSSGAVLALALTQTASAQNVINENTTIYNRLCVGFDCAAEETWDNPKDTRIRIKDVNTGIDFDDTSTSGSYAANDWKIKIGDHAIYGEAYFGIVDVTAGTDPFRIMAGAPSSSLVVADDGNIGIGTAFPQAGLHLAEPFEASLRLEDAGGTPYIWDLRGNDSGLYVYDLQSPGIPFEIRAGAPSGALYVSENGFLGVGTRNPQYAMHLIRNDGEATLRIEETNGTQTARPLLNMVNHGRPDIVMANTATGGEWAFGAGTNFVLKNGAVGSSDGDKNLQLKLFGATGNLEIAGQIITGGPTCGAGCDAVFTQDYDLPSIQEHAAAMFSLGHLPNVGPTAEDTPVNLTDKLGRVLNELEHAHIYIAELEKRDRERRAEIAALASEHAARIAALEARIAAE